ncbi:DUF4815 domain-containing protein [Rhodopseudomonas sp. BR0G17]|uniref:DUF4815 domain-containing protein n=1 Tax=Rhodopseudomonas sp. BR0G17 TaxID=2269368 RepID=UPI0013DEA9DE|nr:DUF4815 domain-containing protein [Rhodopseudomonas sp. BR0G17]NEW96910.1 DUF4815 domain-containing protein [Rhodopseudomonas sp. BR0G17]
MSTDPRNNLTAYINPFDATKGVQALAFHYDRFLGSHELNVLQDIERERLRRIANVILKDGSLVAGGAIVLGTPADGHVEVRLEAASVYIRGAVHDVAARTLLIPAVGTVVVGIRLRTFTVSYPDDATLQGLAPATRAEGEPGASALVMSAKWGWDGDGEEGDFFPIYTIVDGVLVTDPPEPINDAWLELLRRYDRDAHAHYIVEGYQVRAIGLDAISGKQQFSVGEGVVNVYGHKNTRTAAYRLQVVEEPDLHTIENEPHAVGSGTQTITVRFGPIAAIGEIMVEREKTVTLTHGAYSGAVDALPDATAIRIVEVKQGATTYAATTSYILSGSAVDWSPAGGEPAPGSTYTVKYRYIDTVAPSNVTENTFQITGAADGTVAYVTYTMKLSRIDAIVVDRDGVISYRKGIPSLYSPQPLRIASEVLKLADVTNVWGHTPIVKQVGTVRMPFSDIRDLEKMVGDLYALVSEERLQRDVSSREPTAKRGVFVDPFLDDDMRDQGIEQAGAIVGGMLMLPVDATINVVPVADMWLDYTDEVVIEQGRITGSMKINPYQAFDVPMLQVPIAPGIDLWSETVETWTTAATTRIFGWGNWISSRWTTVEERVLSSRTEEIETIRPRSIAFTIDGFGPNEYLTKVTFDGIDVTPHV